MVSRASITTRCARCRGGETCTLSAVRDREELTRGVISHARWDALCLDDVGVKFANAMEEAGASSLTRAAGVGVEEEGVTPV